MNSSGIVRETKDKLKMFNSKYQQVKTIGQGAYAEVYACRYIDPTLVKQQFVETTTSSQQNLLDNLFESLKSKLTHGDLVAVKKYKEKNNREEERYGITIDNVRELKFMQQLTHPNIVKIIDWFFESKKTESSSSMIQHSTNSQVEKISNLFMVMPLCIPIEKLRDRQILQQFDEVDFKSMFKQILQGIDYLHQNYIIHRDIKQENILIDSNRKIVFTDFGLSREYGSVERRLTTPVFTREYRPPEIILGSNKYGVKSDMWAIGVVMVELLMRFEERLFSLTDADDDQSVLKKIFALRGTPTQENWKDYDQLPKKITFKPKPPKQLKNLDKLSGFSQELINIIEQLLSLNPNNRPTAKEVLDNKYFENVPDETKKYADYIGFLLNQQLADLGQS